MPDVPASSPSAVETPEVPALTRAAEGRMVAGVARGISAHLGVDVLWVRLVFVVLALTGGAGFLAYGALWIFVPLDAGSSSSGRRAANRPAPPPAETGLLLVLGGAGVVLGLLLIVSMAGWDVRPLWPLALAGIGAALIWLRADEEQRERLRSGVERVAPARRGGLVQMGLGIALVVVGLVAFAIGGVGLSEAGTLLASVAVTVVGIALVASPFALRVRRERDAERRARIRSEERAELAAALHDSVLQSLALIQRSADDPATVARIARAQERDLRRWLYPVVTPTASSFRTALEATAAEVEDAGDVRVELVCVGDASLDSGTSALVQASREAISNAARHSGVDTVSVFAEITDAQVVVHVRDRGTGFDLQDIPGDRMGVRESIVGRVERHGGRALVTSSPGSGTRIELVMPRERP